MKKQNIKEFISYTIVGIIVSIISLGSYYLLTTFLFNPYNKVELQLSNIISWILACTTAYILNRIFVFRSKDKNILKEGSKFYIGRLSTLIIDMTLMFIFVSLLKYNDKIVKVFVQIVIVLTNYIISKKIVFKK